MHRHGRVLRSRPRRNRLRVLERQDVAAECVLEGYEARGWFVDVPVPWNEMGLDILKREVVTVLRHDGDGVGAREGAEATGFIL